MSRVINACHFQTILVKSLAATNHRPRRWVGRTSSGRKILVRSKDHYCETNPHEDLCGFIEECAVIVGWIKERGYTDMVVGPTDYVGDDFVAVFLPEKGLNGDVEEAKLSLCEW